MYEYKEKLQGYREALEEHQIPFDKVLIRKIKSGTADVPILKQWIDEFENLSEPPTAYFHFRNADVPLPEILRSYNLRVPEDISVVVFSGSGPELQDAGLYNKSVIEVPYEEMGLHAGRLLLDMIDKRPAAREVVLDAKFSPGQGCGVARKRLK
jgi:LacI family transcriptional regulator